MPNLYFYKANYLENDVLKGSAELKSALNKIIGNSKRVLLSEKEEDGITLEILGVANYSNATKDVELDDADFIFGVLGKEKDIFNIQKRNKQNLGASDIEKKDNEYVEFFTYFYLFFDYNVIVYLRSSSAPSINEFCKIFKDTPSSTLDIVPIVREDVLGYVKKKDIIGTTSIRIAVPQDDLLDVYGIKLSKKEFDKLRNENTIELTFDIKPKRGESIFSHNVNIIDKLISAFGKVDKAVVSAKDMGKKAQKYNILDDKFIREVSFKFKADDDDYHEKRHEIREKILEEYKANISDIKNFIKWLIREEWVFWKHLKWTFSISF